MKQFILKNKKALTGIAAMLLIGSVTMSFQDSPLNPVKSYQLYPSGLDTVPEKKFDKAEYDKAMDELNKAM